MLDRVIKICGVTSEADALGAVAQGSNAIGFVFAASPRNIDAHRVADIVRHLPREVLTVGVFRNAEMSEIERIVQVSSVSAVQLHGHETADDVARVKSLVPIVIKALVCEDDLLLEFDESEADFLLVDGENPGSGEMHDFSALERVTLLTPTIAAGGLTPLTVADVIRRYPVAGVDVASGVESAPGVKDPVLVAQFVRAARDSFGQQLRS